MLNCVQQSESADEINTQHVGHDPGANDDEEVLRFYVSIY